MIPTLAAYQRALKDEGLSITAHPGWAEVDRPGPWSPIGVALHHTGTGPTWTTAATIRLLREGRSDLPGPVAHAGLRRSGIVDLVGWHDTNHAGLVDPAVLEAMRKGTLPPAPRSGRDSADGNAALYGLEMYNDGLGEEWPAEQVDAGIRYATALCRLHGWNANHVVFHKGLTTRKPDPKGFPSIATVRSRVAKRLGQPTTRSYVLKDGDGVGEVAARFDVSLRALWNANRDVRWATGARVTIPAGG